MAHWSEYLEREYDRLLEEYFEFVRIPSISALPEYAGDVRRAGEWVVDRLKAAGVEHVELMETGGHPVVYGDWLHAGADKPTIMIYGHFDVQPADPLDLWETPPFEPTIRDGKVFARGASDDKGGMVTPIFATEAMLQTNGALPVNVKFCFEGQEEIGSPDLEPFFDIHKEKFACDVVLTSDGLMHDADTPMILLGLKGLTGLQINVIGPSSDLHSGLHGGVMQNPIEALTHIIASMRHEDGTIAVEGFFDKVVDPTPAGRSKIAEIPFDEEEYAKSVGITEFFGEPGYSTRERNWLRPTLELNGIWGGFQGDGTKTVLPSKAHAKITCRLVANQDPTEIHKLLVAHIKKHAPPGVTVEIEPTAGTGYPYLMSADHPGNKIAADVMHELFGKSPVEVYVGGSIPIVAFFKNSLQSDTINFGWSVGDENLHAPNEFFRLENMKKGMRGYCMILEGMVDYPQD